MHRVLPLLICLWFVPFTAGAGNNDDTPEESREFCPREFKRLLKKTRKHLPKPLPRTPREDEHESEIPKFGLVLKVGQTIPDFLKADGHYVYLITHVNGEEYVVWSLRAPGSWPTDPTKNLVTHSSLYRQLQENTGASDNDIEVYAAGQVQFLNGVTCRVDNKSGTRRGQLEHLAFAENRLEAAGIEFGSIKKRPITMRDDFSKAGADIVLHKEADAMARIHVRVESNPGLTRLRGKLVALHKQLYDEFPEFRHKTTLGYLDHDVLFKAPHLVPDKDLSFEDYYELQSTKLVFKYLQVDGADLAALNTRHLPQGELIELFERGIRLIKEKKRN